jgi:hypothetical protein
MSEYPLYQPSSYNSMKVGLYVVRHLSHNTATTSANREKT